MRLDRLRYASSLAAVLLLGSRPARAQSVFGTMGQDVKNSIGDAWAVWTSPLHGAPRDWLAAAGTFGASAAISPWDDDIDRWAVKQRNDASWSWLKQFREGGAVFSGRQITPVALGLYAVGLAVHSSQLREGLVGCATAYGATSVVRTFVVYPLVARTRPDSGRSGNAPPAQQGDQYDFSFPGTKNWGRHSFPGGHITNVSACASFLTSRFDMGIAKPLPWLVAGAVVVGRTLDRRHWMSDEMIGGFFGYAVGRQIALRSRHRSKQRDASGQPHSSLMVGPTPGGVGVRWSLDF
jgi:membrane-associated phospholipid phosphatase